MVVTVVAAPVVVAAVVMVEVAAMVVVPYHVFFSDPTWGRTRFCPTSNKAGRLISGFKLRDFT